MLCQLVFALAVSCKKEDEGRREEEEKKRVESNRWRWEWWGGLRVSRGMTVTAGSDAMVG
jgi:hypothetical protein